MIKAEAISSCHCYDIEKKQSSESSTLLFVKESSTDRDSVLKILRSFKDSRYSLETLDKRQQCLLKALRSNRKFTPDVYHGLGRISEWSKERICLDQIIEHPTASMLDTRSEYALIMEHMPREWQLEHLLQKKRGQALWDILQSTIEQVVRMHRDIATPISSTTWWGSVKQLRAKLEHNIFLLNRVPVKLRPDYYKNVEATLRNIMKSPRYVQAFKQRIRHGQVKRCHGDLTTSNIWVGQHNHTSSGKSRQKVYMLDCIDFNEMYKNIDILSDLSMLLVDIHVHTHSIEIVEKMINKYLQLVKEQDPEPAQLVLSYYLVEKRLYAPL